uniref:leucine-rich repeat and IQ domain-containing protein 1 n=1 Tax=Scatophagus argus TaxID=75038 RepID=UPI001ED8628D|nr:leucine-rich repeat and IQ domain-containing protein 1 [Scatophagus argus]
MRVIKEKENRKKKKELERIKKDEEEKGKREEEIKKPEGEAKMEVDKMETEKRKTEEEMNLRKEEEEWQKKGEKEKEKREEENRGEEKAGAATEESEERKKQEEMKGKKEEEDADDAKEVAQEKIKEEMWKKDEREHGKVDEELNFEERKKEENNTKEREEEEEATKMEKDRKKMEEEMDMEEMIRKQEAENTIMKEELRPVGEDKKRDKEHERKTKEEEWRKSQRYDKDYRKPEEEMRLEEDEGFKGHDVETTKMENEEENKQEDIRRKEEEENVDVERKTEEEMGENRKEAAEETGLKEKEESKKNVVQDQEVRANEEQEKRPDDSTIGQNENMFTTVNFSQVEDGTTRTSTNLSESAVCSTSTEATPQQQKKSISQTVECENQVAKLSTVTVFLAMCLPEHTEQKRLSWMKDCTSWSKLSLQNRRKQKGCVRSRRGPRRPAEASSLLPLCPESLLRSTGWRSLHEVTTVTLEDLPACSLSTLAQCTKLQSLSLRRCGLKSLEGISQLPQLCHIDAQENDISFIDCENMTSLRVLQLSRNKLASIHGLAGAENLDVLDLSHNSITRIAGLESVRRLQRLSMDHNQLISTKGLRDVYTLLHLNCSHNHLASVEGLENSALLSTLDLRANSLTEPPSLNNQVLLRELYLDDNSISSLQGLTACWLPLMQHLSVAQNRITQLPSMSDCVSLANLDLRFNCMSELQNVCQSLEGCQFLQQVHLTGNPLQQESGWRSTLQKAVPGLSPWPIDGQQTDSSLSPPAVQQVSLASGGFLTFCQAQLQQNRDLQQQHSRELSNASSSLDALKTSCRHFTEALQLATDQRFAHEYGDTTVVEKHRGTVQKTLEETLDMVSTNGEKCTEHPEKESADKVSPVFPNGDNITCTFWTFDEEAAVEGRRDAVAIAPKRGPTVNKVNSGSVHSMAATEKTISSNLNVAPVSNHRDLELQNTAVVVIQQQWRKYRQKCGNINNLSTAENGGGRGGDGAKPKSGPSYFNRSSVGQDSAATVIQAFWRGFTLRRRLASALAAVTCPDTGEDDTFEEVDVDEFVFDEAALEKHWTLLLSEDSPSSHYLLSEQPLSLKPPGPFPEPSQFIPPPPLVRSSKQAWVDAELVDSAGQRVSPQSSNRSKSPASPSVVSGLSERSEKILEEWGFTHSHTALLMLKRAQKMKSKKQQQKKCQDPSVPLALFGNCSYQLGQVEARNRKAQHNRKYRKVGEAELGLQQAERTERVKQEGAQQWLHTQAARSDRDSESVHFLPEMSSDILNGGRVQLVADSGYTERLHHASGLWANSSLAAQPCKENNYPRRNSLGHAREKLPAPERVTSAPTKKERISFRDNPVQLSGGWGGGKKREKVYK